LLQYLEIGLRVAPEAPPLAGRAGNHENRFWFLSFNVLAGGPGSLALAFARHCFPRRIRRNPASQHRTPVTKSSNGVQSPRLFSERSPSTCSPKGFAVAVHGTSIQSKAVDPTTQLSSMQLCRADLSPPYTSTSVARAFVVRSSGLPVDSVRRPLSVPEGEETVPTRFPPSRKMRSECFDSFQPFNRPILRKIEQ